MGVPLYKKVGRTFETPWAGTVAILAQGTDWAVAVTQAFFVRGSIPAACRSCLAGGNLAALLTLAGPEPALYSSQWMVSLLWDSDPRPPAY